MDDYKLRLEFIENHKEEMAEMKKKYTFHFVKVEGSEKWFDLYRKPWKIWMMNYKI